MVADWLGNLNILSQFDLDLISQGHHKCDKWCTITPSVISITLKSVSLTVSEIWPAENFEGQSNLDLIPQGHHKQGK